MIEGQWRTHTFHFICFFPLSTQKQSRIAMHQLPCLVGHWLVHLVDQEDGLCFLSSHSSIWLMIVLVLSLTLPSANGWLPLGYPLCQFLGMHWGQCISCLPMLLQFCLHISSHSAQASQFQIYHLFLGGPFSVLQVGTVGTCNCLIALSLERGKKEAEGMKSVSSLLLLNHGCPSSPCQEQTVFPTR